MSNNNLPSSNDQLSSVASSDGISVDVNEPSLDSTNDSCSISKFDNTFIIEGVLFEFSTYNNAQLSGRKSKDGWVTLGYYNPYKMPQIIRKNHNTLAYLSKELSVLKHVCLLV